MGVGRAGEAMMVTGASAIGSRRFLMGMSARGTRSTTSSNWW
jgi:hypothetical protein